jgi:hypothetical protein
MTVKRAFTVYYNDSTGEMESIKKSKDFENESGLFLADVLQDCSRAVESMFEEAKKKVVKEYKAKGGNFAKMNDEDIITLLRL